MTKIDSVTGYEITQEESFIDILSTLKTLFWGIFCMKSSTAGSVVINTTMNDNINEEFVASNHDFAQAIGTLLFSLFETISVIVILNILKATMTNTFQRVTGNSYTERKYSCHFLCTLNYRHP
jgi:transient receptor potential cation channel subfamily C protein 4